MDSGRSTIRIFLLILILAVTGVTQERFVKPIDEANLEPSFLAFRTKLIAAAERQDAKYILSIVDPNISNGFGGRDGIANFKKDWKIESKNSEFWAEFLPVIKNGGHFIGEGRNRLSLFAAPYTFNGFPDDLDEIPNFAIFGSDVNLRRAPNTSSDVVAKLSYNIVKLIEEAGSTAEGQRRSGWYKVKTLGGLTGYVKSEFVRADIDYRAGFAKKRGRWVMTFFLAGD
jgi:hypothetical protein